MADPTKLLILDCPLLSDSDGLSSGVTGFYYQLANFGGKWSGAQLQRSVDGMHFTVVGSASVPMTWGVVTNPPGAIPSLFTWDTQNSIIIKLLNAPKPLVGVSDPYVLNGSNVGAIIKVNGDVELLQWAQASTASDGITVTLTRLMRGLRGTDWAASGHTAGELFVVLDGTQAHRFWALSELNMARWFRAVTVGATAVGSATTQKTLAGNDLKPYAPIRVNASFDSSNNLTITWIRQTRIGGDSDWLDGVTDVPLSEVAESYEVDILDGSGAVVRTLTNLQSPTAVYPRTLQVIDFGSPPATYTVVVYQKSAVVGRGFGRSAIVPQAWPYPVAAMYSTSPSAGVLALDASSSSSFRVLLDQNVTSLSVSRPSDQQRISIMWVQNTVGGHSVNMPSNFFGATAPNSTANSVSTQSFTYDAATDTWYVAGGGSGASWYPGSGAPSTLHNDGDFYLNVTNGDVYKQLSGAWGSPVANIKGPQGIQGITGNPGITVGTSPPGSPSTGDLWVDTN